MKRNRRRLESVWRWNTTENNLKAAEVASNLYLAKVEAARKAYFAVWISKASNQQAVLFCIIRESYLELATTVGLHLAFLVTSLQHF